MCGWLFPGAPLEGSRQCFHVTEGETEAPKGLDGLSPHTQLLYTVTLKVKSLSTVFSQYKPSAVYPNPEG